MTVVRRECAVKISKPEHQGPLCSEIDMLRLLPRHPNIVYFIKSFV